MYRSAAKRLLSSSTKSKSNGIGRVGLWLYGKQSPTQQPIIGRNRIITVPPYSFSGCYCYNQNQNRFLSTTQPPPLTSFVDQANQQQGTHGGVFGDNNNNNASSSSKSRLEGGTKRTRASSNYQEEQSRVLAASLPHVFKLGWSEAAMIAGARDVSLSPSIVGSIPRKEAALVEYFMDECLQKLIDEIDSGKLELQNLVPSERIAKLVKTRLEIQAPYISKWPQALSIQAQPLNFSTSFKQRAELVDEICHAASDEGSGVDWYLKRTVLGGIYSTTEIYMLTDNSTDFQDTWTFLNDRVRDAFDLKKTFQEVKYFTEAVGAGVGGSFQGFMKKGYCACRLSDAGLKALVVAAPALRSVNLGCCSLLTVDAINNLADKLGPVLKELYIDECFDLDAKHILPALLKLKQLEVLSVSHNESVDNFFIIKFVAARGQKMKELVLANCTKLTDKALRAISKSCPGLCSIDLTKVCKLTDKSLAHLANGCQKIQILKFCKNMFSDVAVAAYLEVCGARLREVSLNHVNKVAHHTAISLAKHARNLESLDLSFCREMTNEVLGLIADGCLSLKILKLFGCTQVTNVFTDGHSNDGVKIIGLVESEILKNIEAVEQLPLRYSSA